MGNQRLTSSSKARFQLTFEALWPWLNIRPFKSRRESDNVSKPHVREAIAASLNCKQLKGVEHRDLLGRVLGQSRQWVDCKRDAQQPVGTTMCKRFSNIFVWTAWSWWVVPLFTWRCAMCNFGNRRAALYGKNIRTRRWTLTSQIYSSIWFFQRDGIIRGKIPNRAESE